MKPLGPTLVGSGLMAAALFAGFFLVASRLPETTILAWDRAGILLGYLVLCLSTALGLVTWLRRQRLGEVIGRWLGRRTFAGTGSPLRLDAEVEAVVIPVSRYQQPAWILHHLKPRYAALLYTGRSRGDAETLARDLGAAGVIFEPPLPEIERHGWVVGDPHDPREAKDLVARFLDRFRRLGVAPEGTFVDTTGGTVPMSVGAFQAAEEAGVSSLYVRGTVYPEGGTTPIIQDPGDRSHGEPLILSDRRSKP